MFNTETGARNSTTWEYFEGKSKYSELTSINRFNKFKIVQYLTPESLEKLMKLKEEGLMNVIKKDEDGTYISWSRPPSILVKGRSVALPPIVVVDKNEHPIAGEIGDGSDIICKVEVRRYTTPMKTKGISARLAAVRVDNLVPFKKEQFSDVKLRAIEGLDEQPSSLRSNSF